MSSAPAPAPAPVPVPAAAGAAAPAPDVPPDDYFSMLGFFRFVIHSIPNRIDRAEEVRKYLFEAQALPESFPDGWLDDVKEYKEDSIDSKQEGIKSLLHDLYRHFQSELNTLPDYESNTNDGNTNNESLGPSWPPRAGAAAYNNNNTINNNSYSTNSEVNMRMRLPPGFGRRRRSTRKTKGGKRHRRNTRRRRNTRK